MTFHIVELSGKEFKDRYKNSKFVHRRFHDADCSLSNEVIYDAYEIREGYNNVGFIEIPFWLSEDVSVDDKCFLLNVEIPDEAKTVIEYYPDGPRFASNIIIVLDGQDWCPTCKRYHPQWGYPGWGYPGYHQR